MKKELEHLNLLAIFHYVMAGLTLLVSLIPLIYVFMGIMFITSVPAQARGGGPSPAFIGWLFIGFGGAATVLGITLAVLTFIAGRYLHQHKGRMFCFVVAVMLCLSGVMASNIPGLVLGIFTIIVLSQKPVQELFEGRYEFHDPEDDDYDTRRPRRLANRDDDEQDHDEDEDRDRPSRRYDGDGYYAPRGENY